MATQNQQAEDGYAEMRVKREELTKAIAALEERRLEEARQREGSIVIGDAVKELQLDHSPQEILAEIQAQRTALPMQARPRRVWPPEKVAEARTVAAIFVVPLVMLWIAAQVLKPSQTPQPGAMHANFDLGPQWWHGAVFKGYHVDWNESGFDASSVLKPLSQIPDGQPVHCNTSSLRQLLQGLAPTVSPQSPPAPAVSPQLFDVRPQLHRPWTIVKHDGQVYLQAWVGRKFTQEQARGQRVLIHSTPDSFEFGITPVPISLPVTSLKQRVIEGPGTLPWFDGPAMLVEGPRLDRYAWSKW